MFAGLKEKLEAKRQQQLAQACRIDTAGEAATKPASVGVVPSSAASKQDGSSGDAPDSASFDKVDNGERKRPRDYSSAFFGSEGLRQPKDHIVRGMRWANAAAEGEVRLAPKALWTHDELKRHTRRYLALLTKELSRVAPLVKLCVADGRGGSLLCAIPGGTVVYLLCGEESLELEDAMVRCEKLFSEPDDLEPSAPLSKFLCAFAPGDTATAGDMTGFTNAVSSTSPRSRDERSVGNRGDMRKDSLRTELAKLMDIINSLWGYLLFYTREVLRRQWSFDVYRARQNAIGEDVHRSRGSIIAEARDAVLQMWATHTAVMRLIALLLQSCVAMHTASTEGASGTTHEKPASRIPPEVVDGAHRLMLHALRREYHECKQAYVELTMGSANWRLGLFSGGDVHMRRSLEKIERSRIAHVLSNESAMSMLHAVREVTDFAETNDSMLASFGL